ncbi:YlxR family protein [Cryobacterium sp. Hz9]|uniref:YlxR family protein n=1 Tax=Cryobacterium sp. Hz9 TaxID=1259167 RepID=UPI00106B91B7|nr:YlxR family protein [Cryobacterium sp. Hz9]TFB65149.1 YlxR family protein [Cryobacterium sp. Hz9]
MKSVRTCIGCRSRAPRSSLLRIVAGNSEIVVDETATLPGRGAWLHARHSCFQDAVRRHAFGRAFRVTRSLDAKQLENRLNWLMDN